MLKGPRARFEYEIQGAILRGRLGRGSLSRGVEADYGRRVYRARSVPPEAPTSAGPWKS
jgi:hypothetical protein